ncbi:MAG: ATP-dependent protease ATPase subunit HslU [Clostridia bacterium]|nr:ATP-dependent protease ATPase subunit HslU [Clostridia bacterium]
MTPKEIVSELDKYIIGQDRAKRAVAIALRNRYRRSQLPENLKEDITPKNILMKGPTGVGKTEIARRLAKLVRAPFVKVEATKYTEVGYVGRDVESMIRDLVETSIRLVKDEKFEEVKATATNNANKKLRDILLKSHKKPAQTTTTNKDDNSIEIVVQDESKSDAEKLLKEVEAGKHDKEIIEIEVTEAPKAIEIIPGTQDSNLNDMLSGFLPKRKKMRKITVAQARRNLVHEESSRLIDMDAVNEEGVRRAEQEGIIFIDEIDKIAIARGNGNGPDVSREGVQRDILPFVEGCTVNTKYGLIKTDYILFIAAGAFHIAKMEDLIPELQGRFPIRVELENLTKDDFFKILTQPKNAITMQQAELLKVDNIDLEFEEDALKEVARIAELENENNENIGARRLHTIMETLLEEISFNADGDYPLSKVKITRDFVLKALESTVKKYDITRYIM